MEEGTENNAPQGARPSEPGTPRVNGARTPEVVKRRRPPLVGIAIGLIVLALALFFGIRWFRYNASHTGTDDAQVGGDIYAISPQITGYVTNVYPGTNQLVHSGDLLVTIDPRPLQAAVEQAEANLKSLQAAEAASRSQVAVTRETTGAGTRGAEAAVGAARANVGEANSKVATARAGVQAALAAVKAAQAAAQSARNSIASADEGVLTARSELSSARSGLAAAVANQRKVAADARRYYSLYREGAVPAQQYESSQAALSTAIAQTQEAQQAVQQSQERIAQMQAAAATSRSQAAQSAAAVQQAQVGVLQAQDQVMQGEAGVAQALAQFNQSVASLQSAQSAPAQVSVTASNAASNNAKIAQAKAQLNSARLQLSYAKIFAPVDGYVSEKTVEPGQLVQPGQQLMAVVPLKGTYVDANFKETQMQDIHVGQPADIDVDAYGGHTFHGVVSSIASATGATFSLLPPENATGNFVKVVQRIPVRISIDQKSDPNHLLRLGMSVNVTITTKP